MSMKFILHFQEKDQVQKKMQELIEENACLEFEKANMKEGYKGGLRRMLSSSSELFSGSQLQIAGMDRL